MTTIWCPWDEMWLGPEADDHWCPAMDEHVACELVNE